MNTKIAKYENELNLFTNLYKELHNYYKGGLVTGQYCEGFISLNEKEKDYVLRLSKCNFAGFIALIKDITLHKNNNEKSFNLWTYWGCRIKDLRSLNTVLLQYIEYLKTK